VQFWPDAPAMAGHLQGGHVMATHLDSVLPDGHLEGTHLQDGHHWPAAAVAYEAGPFVFGRFGHAVVTTDMIGNATTQGVTVQETVVNSDPPPASDLMPTGYDPVTGRMTFSFTASDRLTG
jgi:hypothetical protein